MPLILGIPGGRGGQHPCLDSLLRFEVSALDHSPVIFPILPFVTVPVCLFVFRIFHEVWEPKDQSLNSLSYT